MPHQCTTCGHAFDDGSKEMLSGCPECGGNKFQFHPAGTDVPDKPPEKPEPPAREEPSATASTVSRAATRVRDFVSTAPDDLGANETDSGPYDDTGPQEDPAQSAARSESFDDSPDPHAPWPEEADSAPDDEIIDADARETGRAIGDAEDTAQAAAGSDTATAADATTTGTEDGPAEGGVASSGRGLAAAEDAARAPASDGRVVSEPTGENPDIAELREQLNEQFESIKIVEPGQYELNLMELYDREEYIIALQENGRYVIQVPDTWMGDEPGDR